MASTSGILYESPLKVCAVDVVDLLADDSSSEEVLDVVAPTGKCDALGHNEEDDDDDDDDDQLSLYEDALEGMGDEELLDDSMKLVA